MDQLLIQRTRYQLQARVRRARSCDAAHLLPNLRYLFQFVESHPVLGPILATQVAKHPGAKDALTASEKDDDVYLGQTEGEQVVVAVWLLKKVAGFAHVHNLLGNFSHWIGCNGRRTDEIAEFLKGAYLDLFHEYLDEQIDSRNVLLSVIRQYKHQREWFGRQHLQSVAMGREGKNGERALCMDLYEYLYEKGVEFTLETDSASGRIDLLVHQGDDRSRLPIDAKYVRESDGPATIKKTLADGFRQVYDYCGDFQEAVGYLVIFKATSRVIDIECDIDDSYPSVSLGSRTIYFVEVDMGSYEGADGERLSASKRGRANVVQVTREELVRLIQEEEPPEAGGEPQ